MEHDNSTDEGELLLFRTLWNNSNDNMFIVSMDSNGDFISESCNTAQEKTFNLEPNQLNSVNLKDLFDESTYKTIADRYTQCIKLKKSLTYDESAVLGTEERFWNTTILPVFDNENKSVRIFGISREITELKNLEKELYSANEALERQVEERTRELTESLVKIKEISIRDPLTDLFNRRKLDESLEYEVKRAKRYEDALGLILIDIDDFKNINDQYGHQLGDTVLVEFANILRSSVRETDIVGRWGGEEFLVICPQCDLEASKVLAEHIRANVASFIFTEVEHQTASLGVSTLQGDEMPHDILKRVDKALYKSKNSCKNCVSI